MERRDVRTSLVALHPVTEYRPDREPRVTGYQLTNSVNVTVRDIDATGSVVDGALAAGATSLDGLGFRVEDPSVAEAEARRPPSPMRGRGLRRWRPRRVFAGSGRRDRRGWSGSRARAARVCPQALATGADTPIEGGTQDVVVSVVVTFAIG